jgi:hypothetical protein
MADNTPTPRQLALSAFLESHKHLPAQGSAEWLAQKQHTIGGSQIATVLGVNKYETFSSLVMQKAGLLPFKKAAPLWFGTIMERCIEQYVLLTYDSKVSETGSLPSKWPRVTYSPDGVAIIKKNKLREIFSAEDYVKIHDTSKFKSVSNLQRDCDELIVLMEFKAPYARVPQPGKIPEYYIPQPQLGMQVIDIAEVALFIECVFRFCSLDDIDTDNYSRYHYDRKRHSGKLCAGIMGIYAHPEGTLSDEDAGKANDILIKIQSQSNDFMQRDAGTVESKCLDELLQAMAEGLLVVEYSDMIDFRHKPNTDMGTYHRYLKQHIEEQFSSEKYTLVLAYKLCSVNTNKVFKQDILTDDVLASVDKVFEIVESVKGMSDADAKKNIGEQCQQEGKAK